jgi:hypothetical protein
MVNHFIIVEFLVVSENEGCRNIDDVGIVVQQEEKNIHVDWCWFLFLNPFQDMAHDQWKQVNRTDQIEEDAAIELIE